MKQPTTTQKRDFINHSNKLNYALVRAVVLLLMFAVFAGLASAQIGTTTLDVPGTSPWYDTGIDVFAGYELNITATGIVTYDVWHGKSADANGGDWTGQNFFSDAVLPDTRIHSLIGKIGGTTDVGTNPPVPEGVLGEGPGFVGTLYDEQVPTSGRLFLGYNDEIPGFSDNADSFHVTVTVVPEPSTIALVGLGVLLLLRKRLADRDDA